MTAPTIAQLWTVGQADDCNIQVRDEWVSPVHCCIALDTNGDYWVRDAMSTNGTWLDRNTGVITALNRTIRVRDWTPWPPGHTLRIGHSAIPRYR